MPDQEKTATRAADPIGQVRVVPDIPIIFADAVLSQSFGFGVTKFFLTRYDPDPHARPEFAKEAIIAQVIMPTENFIRMVAFFEHRMRLMVEQNALKQADVDAARQYWIDNPAGA